MMKENWVATIKFFLQEHEKFCEKLEIGDVIGIESFVQFYNGFYKKAKRSPKIYQYYQGRFNEWDFDPIYGLKREFIERGVKKSLLMK